MLSLDDILAAPRDPELLQRHLQNLGYLSPPEAPEAPPTIAPMTPPEVAPEVRPMTKPVLPTHDSGHPHLPAMHSEELAEAPTMTRPEVPAMSSAAPFVAPMTPPTLSEAEKKALPITSPGAPAGSVPFYEGELERAIANRPDKMSDHPSFGGKVGHVLGRIGNIALDTFAPGVALNIPGTDLYNRAHQQAAERNLAEAQQAESQGKLRTAQTDEAEATAAERRAQAAKLGGGGEPDLILDPAGNIRGWHDGKGGLHSLEEEGTPKAIQDMAKNWQGKERGGKENLEQALTGAMQDVIDKGGDPAKDPAVQAWVDKIKDLKPSKERDVNTVEDLKHRLVVAAESGDIPEARRLQGLLQATDPEGMARLAEARGEHEDKRREREEKEAEDIVRGYDKNGEEYITSKGNARDMNLQHLTKATPKEIDDAKQNYSALNDMGAKARNLKNSAKALDQNAYQKTLIQTALRGHPDDYATRSAIALMNPQSQEYVMDVFSLREAALALPKQTTGGSRVSEPQAQALWNTIPATGGDSKYATKQLRKFDENLTRLWKKVPGIEGQTKERPFSEEERGGGAGGGHNFSINGTRYYNVPDDIYQRSKQRPGFKE